MASRDAPAFLELYCLASLHALRGVHSATLTTLPWA